MNNAGTNIKARTIRELTPEAWDVMIRTNLDGAFYCTKAVLPQMLDRKDGVIVNVVSVAGKRANPLGGAAYVAAKFGMGGLGLVLANEEKDSGVRVSNVYPGEIDTPILADRPRPVTRGAAGGDPEAGGRGRGGAVRGRAAAARVGAGTGHQADGAAVLGEPGAAAGPCRSVRAGPAPVTRSGPCTTHETLSREPWSRASWPSPSAHCLHVRSARR